MANFQMKNVSISFNLLDIDEIKQYEHAKKRKNVSRYIKKLIQRDMDNGFGQKVIYAVPPNVQQASELEANFDDGLMEGFI